MKKSPKKKIIGHSKGVSLVIALLITGVMVFFATVASITVVESIRQSASVNSANVAYYGAEGALEQGLYENLQQGTGYSTSTPQQVVLGEGERTCNNLNSTSACQYCCYTTFNCTTNDYGIGSPSHTICLSNYENCYKACPTTTATYPGATVQPQSLGDSKASYDIKGQVSSSDTINGYNSIPTPGTGKAGKDCNPLDPPLVPANYYPNIDMFAFLSDLNRFYAMFISTAHAQPDQPGATNITGGSYPITTTIPIITAVPPEDHPCNWGTIKTGETITIPLYYTDASGTSNSLFSTSSSLELRLRTPCQDKNHYCYSNNRFSLDVAKDDPIIAWQIYAQDNTSGDTYMLRPSSADIIKESNINISTFGGTTSTPLLNLNRQGTDLQKQTGTIMQFLTNEGPWSGTGRYIKNPVFKFSVIHSLISSSNSSTGKPMNIPYLEYQILTKDTYSGATAQPPTSEAQTITAEGTSGNFKQVLEVKVPQERGILEYVIQQ